MKKAKETVISAKQAGFPLIELTAALAIAAAMLVGGGAVVTVVHGSGGGAGASVRSAPGR